MMPSDSQYLCFFQTQSRAFSILELCIFNYPFPKQKASKFPLFQMPTKVAPKEAHIIRLGPSSFQTPGTSTIKPMYATNCCCCIPTSIVCAEGWCTRCTRYTVFTLQASLPVNRYTRVYYLDSTYNKNHLAERLLG